MNEVTAIAAENSDNPCVGRGLTSPECIQFQAGERNLSLLESLQRKLFDRFSILRSSAFRLGVMFWVLFTVCFGVGLYGFYATLQDRVLASIDDSITDRFAQVHEVFDANGLEAVIQLAEARASSPMSSSMGFHLSTTQGDRIAGNVPVCLTEPGWDVLVGEDLGLEDDDSTYRFYTASVGGNVLSLGKSLDDLVELRQIALTCMLWMLAISTLLAFIAAFVFSQRTHKRVLGISGALNRVAAGNLVTRLPVSCAGDDIDILSGKINQSLDRLSQTVEGMRQVSTDIAHDLKTPLNRLHITIEEAATKSRAGGCVGDDLDGALDEAQAISGTFEALLRIAQIEAGAKKSQFKEFDLKELLETAAEVYSPVVEEQQQMLKVDVQPGADGRSVPLFGDKNLMLQLVVNLVENAVNHCDAGTSIVISGGERDGEAWLRVADSGLGIPDHEREKVFQRLYRLERSRTTKGTGLGLSLVKAIADLHCGAISVDDNKPGLAITVRFDNNCPVE